MTLPRPSFCRSRWIGCVAWLAGLGVAATPAAASTQDTVHTAYVKASNPGQGDNFGNSVAVHGSLMVVGAMGEDSGASGVDADQTDDGATQAGAAYVYRRDGAGWSQEAYLKASNTDAGDTFSRGVAVWGDTVIVGSPWEASDATGVDGDQTSNGFMLAGAAYVFVRRPAGWAQEAYLKPSDTTDIMEFRRQVALWGDTAAIAAPAAVGRQGVVYIFVRGPGGWTQQARLEASEPDFDDLFGHSMALEGDTLVVGAVGEDSAATGVDGDGADDSASFAGAAYVFERAGSSWSQTAYLKASNTEASDFFGNSVALHGDTIAVGASGEDSAAPGAGGDPDDDSVPDAGAAYVFRRSGDSWVQEAFLKAENAGADDLFGVHVALVDDALVVGASGEDGSAPGVDGPVDEAAPDAGAAYVFTRAGTRWSPHAYVKAADPDPKDGLALTLAASGDTLVVTSTREDGSSAGVGGDVLSDDLSNAGAAYVIDLGLDPWDELRGGAAGAAGAPLLVGAGSLEAGTTASVALSSAPPGAPVVAWLGLASDPVSALGGILWPQPVVLQRLATADAAGTLSVTTPWRPGVAAGTSFWVQMLVADPSVPSGLTLSNGLRATTP